MANLYVSKTEVYLLGYIYNCADSKTQLKLSQADKKARDDKDFADRNIEQTL